MIFFLFSVFICKSLYEPSLLYQYSLDVSTVMPVTLVMSPISMLCNIAKCNGAWRRFDEVIKCFLVLLMVLQLII